MQTESARTIWPKAILTLAMGNAHGKHRPNNIWLKAKINPRCIDHHIQSDTAEKIRSIPRDRISIDDVLLDFGHTVRRLHDELD